jgi:hypothetical protein
MSTNSACKLVRRLNQVFIKGKPIPGNKLIKKSTQKREEKILNQPKPIIAQKSI